MADRMNNNATARTARTPPPAMRAGGAVGRQMRKLVCAGASDPGRDIDATAWTSARPPR